MKIVLFSSHALLAVGYSDNSHSFIVRNSWGENWVRYFENKDVSFSLFYEIGLYLG